VLVYQVYCIVQFYFFYAILPIEFMYVPSKTHTHNATKKVKAVHMTVLDASALEQ